MNTAGSANFLKIGIELKFLLLLRLRVLNLHIIHSLKKTWSCLTKKQPRLKAPFQKMKLVAAILSGTFAALASVCGKLALDESIDIVLRGVALVALVACNATMLQFFVRALRDTGSVVGTTVNASANVAVSAILGAVFFGEVDKLTPNWLIGALLAVTGMYCITRGTNREKIE